MICRNAGCGLSASADRAAARVLTLRLESGQGARGRPSELAAGSAEERTPTAGGLIFLSLIDRGETVAVPSGSCEVTSLIPWSMEAELAFVVVQVRTEVFAFELPEPLSRKDEIVLIKSG
jgi:hypothetical protein